MDLVRNRLLPAITGIIVIVTSACATHGQYSPPIDSHSERPSQQCDSIWDGALFGTLPGVGVALFYKVMQADTGVDGPSTFVAVGLGAGVGALAGIGLDMMNCDGS